MKQARNYGQWHRAETGRGVSIVWRVRPRLARLAVTGALIPAGIGRLAAQPPDPETLRKYAADGERALAGGRYAEAQQAYETLQRLAPGSGEINARLGLIYFQQASYAEAIAPLREALRLTPSQPKVEALLAMALSELGRYEEALPAAKRTFAQTSDSVLKRMVGLHLQRIYTGLGRDGEAVEVALRLTRLYPDDPEVLYHAGKLLANFAYLQTVRLATVAPDSVWLHQAAGEANESQGLYEEALVAYRQVVAKAPRRPGTHFRIGRVLLERSARDGSNGDEAEARRAFEEELAVDPTNGNAAYELAELDRRAGDLEHARLRFEQAVAHHPTFEHARIGLARTLIELGRPGEAVPHLKAALAQHPDDSVAFYHLARASRALGDTRGQAEALAQFSRTRALAADRERALRAKADVTPQTIDSRPPD